MRCHPSSVCARGRAFVLVLALVLAAAARAPGQQTPEIAPQELERAERLRADLRHMVQLARDRVFPALVNINVITVRYWGGKEQKGQSTGSGTIISPEGHVLTNFHVVENGETFKVTLSDKQEIEATLVGEDPLTDLAVLKLNLDELCDPDMRLPYAVFGNSDELEIGDSVMAMGSPLALSRSVTRGSVSNTERILAGSDDEAGELYFDRDQRTGIFNRWIQHDAPISPGNSGGPLVNLKGEIVGVNTRGVSFGGDIGFAIPSTIAQTVAEALIEHGEVPRSWYGVALKSIKKTGLDQGVLINSVVDDSPAQRAGIQAGDVITRVDGQPLRIWYPEEIPPLLKEMADRPIGAEVRVEYLRDGETHTTTLVTERLKRDRGEEEAFRSWGINAQDITDRMARLRRLEDTRGVLVSGVASGSPATMAEPPLYPGDIIRGIEGKAVTNLAEFIAAYESIMDSDELPEYVLVEFERTGKSNVTLLEPEPDEMEDPPREIPKAWIGVATQPVIDRLARQLGHPDTLGYRITRVYPRTKAAETDLQIGDVIVALNEDPLRPRGMQDSEMFQRLVRRLDIGGTASLTVLRNGEQREVEVPLERTRITPDEALRAQNRDFELLIRQVTFFDRDERRWNEDVKGVLVVSVESAGWAGLGGIRPGDLIQEIQQRPIRGRKSFREAMEAIAEAKPERVEFVVLRGVETRFQYIEPDWDPSLDDAETQPAKAAEAPTDGSAAAEEEEE